MLLQRVVLDGGLALGWLIALGCLMALGCGSKGHPPPPAQEGPRGSGGSRNVPGNGGAEGGGGSAGSASAGGDSGAFGRSGASGTSAGSGGTQGEGPSCIPRQECQRYCRAFGSDPASCGLGDSSQCTCICEQRFNGPCPDELRAVLECVGSAPDSDCATRGRIFAGCENESLALEICDFRAREQLCAQSYPRCLPYCQAVVLSYCPRGPESVSSCLCGCETTLVGRCSAQFDAFMGCAGDAPSFSCDGSGRGVASNCPSEWQALDACITQRPDAGN